MSEVKHYSDLCRSHRLAVDLVAICGLNRFLGFLGDPVALYSGSLHVFNCSSPSCHSKGVFCVEKARGLNNM